MSSFVLSIVSFLSIFPSNVRVVFLGLFSILALFLILKLVIAVMDAIPFL